MCSIGAVCNSLGKTFLTLLVGNLGVNSLPVKVELIIFSLFLPVGNAILPMTAKEVCALPISFIGNIYQEPMDLGKYKSSE